MHTGVRPEATKANDLGAVADEFPLEHMLLLLHRPVASESALDALMAGQTDPKSPYYHHWLTAKQVGQYGPAQSDIDTIVSWLASNGFSVNKAHADGMMIDFSGTAGQVKAAFRTEVHHLNVAGVAHIANMNVPQIPTALVPAVNGVVSLHDFMPRSTSMGTPNAVDLVTGSHSNTGNQPDQVCPTGDTYCSGLLVGAQDLATIYDLSALFAANISGAGQTIAVFSDQFPPSSKDYTAFRARNGLAASNLPFLTPDCTVPTTVDPALTTAAISEAEFAGAAAPGAVVEIVSCGNTATTFGGLIAMQNLNSMDDPTMLWSFNFADCEASDGASGNAAFASTYQTAAARGVSVFAATGDLGAAACDFFYPAKNGIAVSETASTPYNVAVGGTDLGSGTWIAGNATSYINEIPWNDDSTSSIVAGGGGPSGCASGAPSPSTPDVVSGTCAGYPKPSWQAGLIGNPGDGVRDIPDVALFAGDGTRYHGYAAECTFDSAHDGCSTTGANPTVFEIGGTEIATAVMAGIQALVNQYTGSAQGNPNPTYYALAAAAYGTSGNPSCDSTLGSGVSSSCVFYDITQGDIVVGCTGSNNCYVASGTVGKLSTSNSSYVPAYAATTGWDFATGIGSVNGYNLALAWPSAYSIGGSVSGLAASGLVLGLTWGSQTASITPGASNYQFATEAPSNAAYTVSVQAQPTGQTCTLANATGTVSTTNVSDVDVTCTTNTYSLSYTTDGNGTINGNPLQTVDYGGSGTAVMAVPNTGYYFVQWSDGSTANPRTDTNVTADINVTASFAINTYTVTPSAGANGAISPNTPQTVNYNGTTTFTVTPNPGYTASVGGTCGGALIGTTYTTNAITADCTVVASFTTDTYTLTYTAGANGTINGSSPQTVNFGSDGSAVTAVPNTGYHFVQWSDGLTVNPRTDVNVTTNISVTADFAANVLTFTTQPSDLIQGDTLGTITVTEQDGAGNTIADTATVDFTISACGGTVDLGSASMVNGVATLNSAQRFYTAPVTGLTITASVTIPNPTPIQSLTSGDFNVSTNSDLVFSGGFESCRL
ncbi:MAG: protease pro-enzyme activation domain-containing protein [Rudaea sp.]|nr:protease pro-enzyme activation domain-containing protein [Rudaea sp.]